MGAQRNLTEGNVTELESHLQKMQEDNPDLEYEFFKQESPKDEQPSNKEIFEKMEAIERQINMIFDGHVLINGVFQKPDIRAWEPSG